jgi:hypothetical protein
MQRIDLKQRLETATLFGVILLSLLALFFPLGELYIYFMSKRSVDFLNSFEASFVAMLIPSWLIWCSLTNKISYDNEAIYYRTSLNNIFPIRPKTLVMRYDEIVNIGFAYWWDIAHSRGTAGRPEAIIRFYRRDWSEKELFIASPENLDRIEMKQFLKFVYGKRPDAFERDVVDFLNSDSLKCPMRGQKQ